jgi:hypothetical protein
MVKNMFRPILISKSKVMLDCRFLAGDIEHCCGGRWKSGGGRLGLEREMINCDTVSVTIRISANSVPF